MGSTREKKMEQFRKKKIWPSIVIFIGVTVLCTCMVAMFVMFFTTYVVTTKVEQMYQKSVLAGENFDHLIEKGMTIGQAAEALGDFMPERSGIYITDENQNEIISTGTSKPDFDMVGSIYLSENIIVIGDSGQDYSQEDKDSLFMIPMEKVFAEAFERSGEDVTEDEWLREAVLDQKFWLQTPLQHQQYQFYVKHTLQIQRQDVIYMCAFGMIAVLMLLIPIVFLFVNTIRAIIMQQKITKLLYLDMVTGGWNWLYFQTFAGRILSRHRNNKKVYAVVELHVERYHNYCACYGVKAGEELLESMNGFLRARTMKGEIYSRYEGADFALLLCCKGQNEEEYRKDCQKRVCSLLAELTGLRTEQKLHFHAGIYIVSPRVAENGRHYMDRKSIDISQLYNCANTARMETRCQEEKRISFFDERMLDKQLWNRKVEENMETALREEEFQVYLQPKYSPTDEKIVGAEALVRWNSPTEGIIMPSRFIPILEENGFITQLDDYMISHVAKLLAEWKIQGRKMISVSINISRAHFAQEGLAEHICQLVDAYGPRHELIELEVTESAFFDDKDILVETVKQLKAYGFHVSMDDFGTGYSSLNSLKDMPLDVLKLDTEFFRGENSSERGEIIVREAIRLAKGLNMRIVAEGIEKKEQVEFLTELGCDMIQGFYFAKPMPVSEFEEKMEKDV